MTHSCPTRRSSDLMPATGPRLASGLGCALLSAASFGLSGALARGLLDQGWSAGAAVTVRVAIAPLVLLLPPTLPLRGRWHLPRNPSPLVAVYGVVALAGCHPCHFSAVDPPHWGAALLIRYPPPVAVVVCLWLRHG